MDAAVSSLVNCPPVLPTKCTIGQCKCYTHCCQLVYPLFLRRGQTVSIKFRMQVGSINAAMSSLVKCLNVFPKERSIVQRERSKSSYGVAPYFCSKLAAESPIGAFFPLLFASIVYPAAGLHQKLSR